MVAHLFCVATVVLGVDVGWRPLPEGGMEYLIQIPPQIVDSLKAGTAIGSDIQPSVKNVRAFRITVGTERLPRDMPSEPPATSTTAAPKEPEKKSPTKSGGEKSSPTGAGTGAVEKPAAPWSNDPFQRSFGPKTGPAEPSPSGATGTSGTGSWPGLPGYRTNTAAGSTSPSTGVIAAGPAFGSPGETTLARPALGTAPVASSSSPAFPSSAAGMPPVGVTTSTEESPSRPWGWLMATSLALVGSLSWNGYLLWALAEARRRYRRLLGQVAPGRGTASDDVEADFDDAGSAAEDV